MTVWFHPEAEAEHLETVVYYETRRAGLGALYLAAFEQALETVRDNPHRYRIVNEPDIRRVPLARFPLSIIYRETSERIEILAVAHHKRRPAYWIARS
ncbi:MAG: type II toxin-antitoxin system RelE/ParE family toxin [Rhodospirillaceae bacterium]|nr:type II toxin-antitoxin system RelE/ParE family toxin [Rhodospirillaceae bacterium]